MKSSPQLNIAGLGEILWDVYDDRKYLGGAPANFACHVEKLGQNGIVLSRVGQDENGALLLDTLSAFGMDTWFIQIDENRSTGTVNIELDSAGNPQFICSNDVAFDYLQEFSPALESASLKLDAILFGSLAQRNVVARKSIQKFISAKPAPFILFDANLRSIDETTKEILFFGLNHSNILKVNENEAQQIRKIVDLAAESELDYFSRLLRKFDLDLLCITYGANGALALTKDDTVYSPGFQVEVEDTTGAGDAFLAGFVVHYLQDHSLQYCLDFANGLGALIAMHKGAIPTYSPEDVTVMLQENEKRNWKEEYRFYFSGIKFF